MLPASRPRHEAPSCVTAEAFVGAVLYATAASRPRFGGAAPPRCPSAGRLAATGWLSRPSAALGLSLRRSARPRADSAGWREGGRRRQLRARGAAHRRRLRRGALQPGELLAGALRSVGRRGRRRARSGGQDQALQLARRRRPDRQREIRRGVGGCRTIPPSCDLPDKGRSCVSPARSVRR
jgi:hypothetical protein